MEVCIFGVLTVNLLTPILIFSFQSAFFSWQASYIKTEKCLILRQIRGLNDDQREASMMPHEGAINASRRKNWCVATEKNSHFTAIFHPIAMHSSLSQPESYELLTGKL